MSEYKQYTIDELSPDEELFELRDAIIKDYFFEDIKYTPSWGNLCIYQGNAPNRLLVLCCFALEEKRVQQWKETKQFLRIK